MPPDPPPWAQHPFALPKEILKSQCPSIFTMRSHNIEEEEVVVVVQEEEAGEAEAEEEEEEEEKEEEDS